MTTTTTTPNMNLPVPVASEDPGPDWASNVVTDMYAIDSHNHSSGQGVPVNPGGLNINSDLPFGSNSATALKSARFTAQSAPLAGGSYLGCIYVSGKDLYYNDEDGNQVRITTGGNVNAGAGSITGLPSGTASVSFAAATYTFLSATNTGATISGGPVAIGSTTASAKQTTLASNASQAANIALVLPTVAPAYALSVMQSDASGNMSWSDSQGTGDVVRKTNAVISTPTINGPQINSAVINAATFTGNAGGKIAATTYTPTITNSSGTTTVPGLFFYQRINDIVSVTGWVSAIPSAGTASFRATLPIDPTSNFATTFDVSGSIGDDAAASQAYVVADVGAKKFFVSIAGGTNIYSVTFMYSCA